MSLAVAVASCFFAGVSMAQGSDVRESLFKDTDQAFQAAREARADILAPTSYRQARDYYRRADDRFKRGRDIEGIRKELGKARGKLKVAMEAAKIAAVTLSSPIKARSDAISAEAGKYAPELWKRAEQKFALAASRLEAGNVKRAQSVGLNAETIFRDAELAAIKANYLTGARSLLAHAKSQRVERYAPKTLDRARSLLARAERELTENRYDPDLPRSLAREAQYEASHAIYLAGIIKNAQSRKIDLETVLLDMETPVRDIGAALDMAVRMDRGYKGPTEEITRQINELRTSSASMSQELDALRYQVAALEEELGGTSERVKAQERAREQMAKLESLFDPGEVQIIREGPNIVLRLVGLSFDSGQAVIKSQYFGLLRKVQDSIKVFPNCTVVVEGHTDSHGADLSNMLLSQKRADSVHEYLSATMGLPEWRVQSVGYGETRPVANNETERGRALNRRIDILIQPDVEGQIASTL